ncbi:MAG: hypothetical protein HQK54_15760, partial [Oligoflexales bacterium]|nr:hypothetical protein [Oligoflexales bacterium]
MKFIFILTGLVLLIQSGCHPRSLNPGLSRLNLEEEGDLSPCSILEGNAQADCQALEIAVATPESLISYIEIGNVYQRRFLGDPMVITSRNKCLAKVNNEVVFTSCKDFDKNYKWHFVDIEVQYKWKGVEMWERAFQIVSRESEVEWAKAKPGEAPALECIDFQKFENKENSGPLKSKQLNKLVLKPCAESKLMFITVPNEISGDDALYQKFHWVRFVGIDLNNKKFSKLAEAQQKYNPYLTKNTLKGGGSLSSVPTQKEETDRVILAEDFTWAEGTYLLNISSPNFEKNKESEGFPILIPAP